MKKIKNIISILIALVLFACAEKPNSPYADDYNTGNNTTISNSKSIYFPTDIGSFWVYQTYNLDSNNTIINGSKSFDSVIVSEKILKADKNSYHFITYNNKGGSYTKDADNYYYIEKDKVYTLQDYLNKFFAGVPMNLLNFSSTEWIKIFDNEDDLWRIFREKLEDASIPGNQFLKMTGKVDILSSWEDIKDIKIGTKTVKAKEFLVTLDFNADINIPILGKQHLYLYRELYLYFAKNIGIVKEKMMSSSLSIPIIGDFKLAGFEKYLIKYHINN